MVIFFLFQGTGWPDCGQLQRVYYVIYSCVSSKRWCSRCISLMLWSSFSFKWLQSWPSCKFPSAVWRCSTSEQAASNIRSICAFSFPRVLATHVTPSASNIAVQEFCLAHAPVHPSQRCWWDGEELEGVERQWRSGLSCMGPAFPSMLRWCGKRIGIFQPWCYCLYSFASVAASPESLSGQVQFHRHYWWLLVVTTSLKEEIQSTSCYNSVPQDVDYFHSCPCTRIPSRFHLSRYIHRLCSLWIYLQSPVPMHPDKHTFSSFSYLSRCYKISHKRLSHWNLLE